MGVFLTLTQPVSINSSNDPLLTPSLIFRFIEKNVINEITPQESKIHLIARRCLQTVAVCGAFSARLLFVRIAYEFTDNPIYGTLLAGSSALSYGAIISWCLLNVIDDLLSPQLEEEKSIKKNTFSGYKHTIFKVGLVFLGVISQIPMAYMTYYYNGIILFPIAVLLIDSGFPIYSLNLTFEKILKRIKKRSPLERRAESVRKDFVSALKLINSTIEMAVLKNRLKVINDIKNQNKNINDFLESLFDNFHYNLIKKNKQSKIELTRKWSSRIIGGALILSQLTLTAVLAFHAAQLIFKSDSISYLTAAGVFSINSILDMKLTIKGVENLIKGGTNFIYCKRKETLSSFYYPKTRLLMQVAAGLICTLSFGGPAKVSQDFFSGQMRYIMQVGTASGTIMLSFAATLILIDKVIEKYMLLKGPDEMKAITSKMKQIRKIIELVEKSSIEEFVKFFHLFSEDIQSQFTSSNLEIENIEEMEEFFNPSRNSLDD